jgi:uncharacterized membrane protein YuzA (DUF378 family)
MLLVYTLVGVSSILSSPELVVVYHMIGFSSCALFLKTVADYDLKKSDKKGGESK